MWKPQTKEAVLREVRIREWRKRIGKGFVKAFSHLAKTIASKIVHLLSWLKCQSTKVAQDVETNRLISQRYDKLLQLGETVYAMYRTGQTSWRAIEPLCQEIEQIERKLDSAKTKPLQVLPYGNEQKEGRQEELTMSSIASQ